MAATRSPAGAAGVRDGAGVEGSTAPPAPLRRLLGADPGTRWRRVALVLVAGLAGLAYAWALGSDPLEPYYAAAVRSMAGSWHDFAFGSFDPAGTISLDKLPGAFWVQALSVRAFGYHGWSMVLPQAIEGVLTVLFLYRAVRRLAGPAAGLLAAAVLAAMPATVALQRGNISDSLLILLLVLAADALSGAVLDGRQGRLVLAGLWVGLAFQAKMVEAWMVLPAFALAYLLDAPGSRRRQLRQLLVAGAVVVVVSLSWMTAVDLVPASQRPFVDGSHDDTTYAQVFVYNGFGRLGDHTPLQLLAGQSLGLASVLSEPPTGPGRLLHGDLGRDAGWLLAPALLVGAWGIASRRRRPRGDPLRACFVLWTGWLVILWLVFSLVTTINAYYTAALSPPVAALLGAGAVAVLEGEVAGTLRARAAGLALLVAGTVAYAGWLLASTGGRAPAWVLPLAAVLGAGAVVLALAALRGDVGRRLPRALLAGLVAACFVPVVASVGLVAARRGAFDTPFEPPGEQRAIDDLFVATPAQVAALVPRLEALQRGAPDLLATETSAVASVFVEESGLEALPIGGFTGTIPSPTLAQLKGEVRAGDFHLVLAGPSTDPRLRWIAAHCLHLPAASGLRSFYCLPSSAGGPGVPAG